jgi:hypothetical protein
VLLLLVRCASARALAWLCEQPTDDVLVWQEPQPWLGLVLTDL